jgi:hypothetical protein
MLSSERQRGPTSSSARMPVSRITARIPRFRRHPEYRYADHFQHLYWRYIDLPFATDGTRLIQPMLPNAETQITAFREIRFYPARCLNDGRAGIRSKACRMPIIGLRQRMTVGPRLAGRGMALYSENVVVTAASSDAGRGNLAAAVCAPALPRVPNQSGSAATAGDHARRVNHGAFRISPVEFRSLR